MHRRHFLSAAALLAVDNLRGAPAAAQLVNKLADDLKNGEFNWFPERSDGGPILIIVSIPDQLVHVYRNGIRIAASTCSTGKPGHRTPTGVFQILQKDIQSLAIDGYVQIRPHPSNRRCKIVCLTEKSWELLSTYEAMLHEKVMKWVAVTGG